MGYHTGQNISSEFLITSWVNGSEVSQEPPIQCHHQSEPYKGRGTCVVCLSNRVHVFTLGQIPVPLHYPAGISPNSFCCTQVETYTVMASPTNRLSMRMYTSPSTLTMCTCLQYSFLLSLPTLQMSRPLQIVSHASL